MIDKVNNLSSMDYKYNRIEKKEINIQKNAKDKDNVILEINSNDNKNTSESIGLYKPDLNKMDKLKNEVEENELTIRNMVEDLLKEQGLEIRKSFKDKLDVSDDIRKKAEELISEDGELGVKKVSERIIEFAKAVSGGDKEKIPELKKAVDKGFKEAERMLGELPEISKKTYGEVMKKFDMWENEDITMNNNENTL